MRELEIEFFLFWRGLELREVLVNLLLRVGWFLWIVVGIVVVGVLIVGFVFVVVVVSVVVIVVNFV